MSASLVPCLSKRLAGNIYALNLCGVSRVLSDGVALLMV